MSGFSHDGQWWWDGTAWIATSQVVIPDLPPTDRAKELEPAVRRFQALDYANLAGSILTILPWAFLQKREFRTYREWTLENFKSAASYLLGPDEPILAAEAGLFSELVAGWVSGGYGVVVTAQHVLVLANESGLGRPRRVLMAAEPRQVTMRLHAGGILNAYPTILVSLGAQTWPIRGMNRVIQPEPVITAWWRLANAVRT